MNIAVVVLALVAAEPHVVDPRVHLSIEPEGDDPTRVVVRYVLPTDLAVKLPAGPLDEAIGRRYLRLGLVNREKWEETGPPVFGHFDVRAGRLEFRPRFSLVRDSTYRVEAYEEHNGEPAYVGGPAYHVPPHGDAPRTEINSIHPQAEVLPANLLRFHISFSRPMREGREVFEGIKLLRVGHGQVEAPWRDIELWDEDATRLTLYIHPGRIKQGVNLREEFGPVLVPGDDYILEITEELRDFRGKQIKRRDLSFRVGLEVRSRIDLSKWKFSAPRVGTTDNLVIEFDRMLDEYSVDRYLNILFDDNGPQEWELQYGGRMAVLKPFTGWKRCNCKIQVDPRLEDVCGNTPVRVFDHDLEAPTVDVLPPVLERVIEIRDAQE